MGSCPGHPEEENRKRVGPSKLGKSQNYSKDLGQRSEDRTQWPWSQDVSPVGDTTHFLSRSSSPLVRGPGQGGWWVTHVMEGGAQEEEVRYRSDEMVCGGWECLSSDTWKECRDFLSPAER